MLSRWTALATCLLCGCARTERSDGAASTACAKPAATPADTLPAPAASTAEPSPSGTPPSEPRKTASGDGITITEAMDGTVTIESSSRWNEPIETTYENCEYYRNAIPVSKKQLSERARKAALRSLQEALS